MRVFLFKLLLSNYAEAKLRHYSTIFNTKIDQASWKICRTVLSKNSTAVFDKFSDIIRQHSTKFFVECCRKMSNAVNCCKNLTKNTVKKWCRFIDSIFSQLFSLNFDKVWQIFCQIMSKFILCWRNLLAKNVVENYC